MRSEPRCARTSVWPLAISLAATFAIEFSFSSSGYLDVSVHRVPFHTLCVGVWISGVCPDGFPHSDIHGSRLICSSPWLFAAYHVFLRLLVPRHPPCALVCLISIYSVIPRQRFLFDFLTFFLVVLLQELVLSNFWFVILSDVLIKN